MQLATPCQFISAAAAAAAATSSSDCPMKSVATLLGVRSQYVGGDLGVQSSKEWCQARRRPPDVSTLHPQADLRCGRLRRRHGLRSYSRLMARLTRAAAAALCPSCSSAGLWPCVLTSAAAACSRAASRRPSASAAAAPRCMRASMSAAVSMSTDHRPESRSSSLSSLMATEQRASTKRSFLRTACCQPSSVTSPYSLGCRGARLQLP